jgi:hypothetical protein
MKYDMRPAVLSRDEQRNGVVKLGTILRDGVLVPCTAKPSSRQAGKVKVEYRVFDSDNTPSRIVWAIVDAAEFTPS